MNSMKICKENSQKYGVESTILSRKILSIKVMHDDKYIPIKMKSHKDKIRTGLYDEIR